MKSKVKNFMNEYKMIDNGDRILVALSGGADSVCLIYLLHQLYGKNNAIFAVHVNHMLREQTALRDELFVEELCRKLDIPLRVFREDVAAYAKAQKMTLEEAGREIRYRCFEECSQNWDCHKIAVAHHEDDLAETVLFRMIRGTGLYGMAAMRPVSANYIRPLLCVSKSEIIEYMESHKMEYVIDETNEEIEFSRNYIRNIIIPQMAHVNGQAVKHIAELSRQALALQEFIMEETDRYIALCTEKTEKGYDLYLTKYREIPSYMKKEILRYILFETAGRRKDIGLIHIQTIYNLIREYENKNKLLNMPYGVTCVLEKNILHFYYADMYQITEPAREEVSYIIEDIGKSESKSLMVDGVKWSFTFKSLNHVDYSNNDCVKYFDYDKIFNGISIRNRKSGDYLVVDRKGHKKSLRRFFIDAKIPKEKRGTTLLLADGNHIMWILGERISEAYKVTEDTRTVLQVKVEYL